MKVFVTLLDFSAQPAVILPRSDSVPGELCPLAPLVTPLSRPFQLVSWHTVFLFLSLKATLVSDVKEVRAAGVRALRYLINDNETKQIFMKLRLDHLITK